MLPLSFFPLLFSGTKPALVERQLPFKVLDSAYSLPSGPYPRAAMPCTRYMPDGVGVEDKDPFRLLLQSCLRDLVDADRLGRCEGTIRYFEHRPEPHGCLLLTCMLGYYGVSSTTLLLIAY